jgi:hypothetical protein
MSDLDLRSILPTSLPVPALNEILAPPSRLPSESNGENQEEAPSDNNSNSNSDEE